ncbi:hypothetical protein GCM10009823_08770 [Brevibacterium salitolerans]|uniref:Uncharacterized protein n=1 Tax=Brevibacterium salitolerans TaxID=1403566 RepID=A0ABN2WH63_9MICO
MSATGSVTAALATVLLLTACGGDPEAPATVGPTAGADPEPTYEPTIPPYTSAVELSSEDREQIDELLLLIDEWVEYASGTTDYHLAGFESLTPRLSADFAKKHQDSLNAESEAQATTRGTISIKNSLVGLYNEGSDAQIWTCVDYTNYKWMRKNESSTEEVDKEDSERLFIHSADLRASDWVLTKEEYYESNCDEIL